MDTTYLRECALVGLVAWVALSSSQVGAEVPTHEVAFRIYVTNESSGDLSVIDGPSAAVIRTVPLGKRPRGVQASPAGDRLYVALSGSPIAGPGTDPSTLPPADKAADGIGVVDVRSLALTGVLRGYSDPEQLAIDERNRRLYIASEDTGMAVVAPLDGGPAIAALPVGGEPEGIALSPDGRWVYVTSEQDHRLTVIDTRTASIVRSIDVGRRPRSIAFAPSGERAYVTGELDASLAIIDVTSHRRIALVHVPGANARPMGAVVSPDGARVYVTTGRGGSVVVVDARTGEVIATVQVGARPWGIGISPDGRRLYTANGPSDDVSVIDAERLVEIRRVKVGTRPWGIAVAPVVEVEHTR